MMDFSGFGVAGGQLSAFQFVPLGGQATLGLVTEVESALAIHRVKRKTLTIAVEAEAPISPVVHKLHVLGIASEIDAALLIQNTSLEIAIESEIALPIGRRKRRQLGIASGQSLAIAITLHTATGPGTLPEPTPSPLPSEDAAWGKLPGVEVEWNAVRDPSTKAELRLKKEDAVKLIHFRLGMASDLDTVISLEMAFQQLVLEGSPQLPYFLQTIMEAHIATDGPTELPPDFLREVDGVGLWIQESEDACWKELSKQDYDTSQTCGEGLPQTYAIVGRLIYFSPMPALSYKVRIGAYMRDDAPNTGFENEWLRHYPDLLMGETGYAVANSIKDQAAIAFFDNMRKEARARMMIDITAWDEAGRLRSISDA